MIKSNDIFDLIDIMNQENCSLPALKIFFGEGYEISFDDEDDAWLWKNNKNLGEIYFFEDLVFEEVLRYNHRTYKFKYFSYGAN